MTKRAFLVTMITRKLHEVFWVLTGIRVWLWLWIERSLKREHEVATSRKMLEIYCHDVHREENASRAMGELCPECQELFAYVQQRIAKCPHMEHKTFCSQWKSHCYAPVRREQIKRVMRYSGPRMLKYSPLQALKHIWLQFIEKK